ncbi:MAG: hypothetical protein H6R18_1251 [Proteobacteria bacterium]|nr:hypothetical protein [Pseudomonadota bacterium]
MLTNSKRQISAIMALLVFFFSAFPAKRSDAAVPLVGLAISAFGPGGTLVSSNVLASVGTALIGGTIVALGITPNNAEAPTRVPLSTDQPTIDAVMPPPVVPQTVSASTGTQYTCAGGYCTGNYGSPAAACAAVVAAGTGGVCSYNPTEYTTLTVTGVTAGSCQIMTQCGSWSPSYIGVTLVPVETTTCPAGYTLNNGSCVLNNARQAQSDNKYDLVRTPTGFALPSAEADSQPSYLSAGSGRIVVTGSDSSGNPVVTTIELNSSGGVKVTANTQSTMGGQSVVNTQTIDTSTNGQVSSVNSTTNQGSISGVGTGEVPVVNTGAAVNPGESLVFPSDYARVGEAATAAQAVKTSVDAVKDQLTSSVDVVDPTVPAWTDPWGTTFNALKGWSLPSHSSSCPQPSFNWEGRVYAFSTHCQLVTDHWSALSAAMMVVWTIAALWFVLTA